MIIIKGKKGPKGVGFLMQIWNGWECDQICLPWHGRDRLINHLPLMWFFVHRIQIIWLWPKSHIIFCLFNPNIFIFFLPNSCHSFCESLQQQKKYYYVTMNSLFQNHKKIIPLECNTWITLICWVEYSLCLIILIMVYL
jgi:hypothetical protein